MVEFEWDEHNSGHIWERHRVTPDEAESALTDTHRMNRDASMHPFEQRRVTIGRTDNGRLLFIVWTRRGTDVRVVSARDASSGERRAYMRRWR